ncbi:MAG: sulfurtransferase TusA family protein [Nitrososphaerales archaeon]
MSGVASPTKTIDVKGLFCPEPVFRTKIEVERMGVGEILKVVADDPEAEEDISRWVKRNGHELVNFTKENKELVFMIKKAK